MKYVKVNDTLYPATISGRAIDRDWDNRESKSVNLDLNYETVNTLFADGIAWSIVMKNTNPAVDDDGNVVVDENGEPTYTTETVEYDNSDYSIRGDLIVHADGTVTVKMGKMTALEEANASLEAISTETANEAIAILTGEDETE